MGAKRKGVTVSRQIMDCQLLHPEATGELTACSYELIVAAKQLSAPR